MDLVTVFWLALGLAALASGVYVVREVRRLPVGSLRKHGPSASWVVLALVVVRIAQMGLVLILVLAASSWLSAGDGGVSTRVGTADAVTLTGDGSIVVRGEPGYMVGLCSGERGARGAVTSGELCADHKRLQLAVGGGTRVDQLVVRREIPRVPGAAWVLVGLGSAMVVLIIIGLEALARMLGEARRGEPFSRVGTWSLRVLAGVVVLVGGVLPAISDAVTRRLVEQYLGEDALVVGDSGGWMWPTLIALSLLALSEIWRCGIRLQEETEGVV